MSHMKRGNRPISLQERSEIMVRAEHKEDDTEIAKAMQLSIAVVRKWRRKARDHGREGLITTMGRPPSGPLGHFAEEMRDLASPTLGNWVLHTPRRRIIKRPLWWISDRFN